MSNGPPRNWLNPLSLVFYRHHREVEHAQAISRLHGGWVNAAPAALVQTQETNQVPAAARPPPPPVTAPILVRIDRPSAITEARREAEESLEIESTATPADLESLITMREDTINRQNQTNLRILAAVSPQLTDEQAQALRVQFDAGHAARMATFRAEQEMVRQVQ